MEHATTDTRLALNSAATIARWVADEIAQGTSNDHMCRVITRETDRWFKNALSANEILLLATEPASTGHPHWDALLQGVIAFRLRAARIPAPAWTSETKLETGWSPYDETIRDNRWYALSVLNTPAALLERGVVLDRRNLELV